MSNRDSYSYIVIAGFIAWRAGVFGGGDGKRSLDINVNTPSSSN